jgi:prevent-host-death family protein
MHPSHEVGAVQKIIGVTDLQRRFKSVLDEVVRDRTPYVLARGSRPEAVLIPYDEFQKYLSWRENVLERFNQVRRELAEHNERYSDEEIDRDIEEAIAEVRAERNARLAAER